jgi:hypothetical protein
MWLSVEMKQSFAMIGLVIAAVFAYLALGNHWLLIPTVLTYGLTKLGIDLIPWLVK